MNVVYVRGAHNSDENMEIDSFFSKIPVSLGSNSLVISNWKTSSLQGSIPKFLFQNMCQSKFSKYEVHPYKRMLAQHSGLSFQFILDRTRN